MKLNLDKYDAKAFSIEAAYACFRYALGGRDETLTIDDCIEWLKCIKAAGRKP